MGVATLNRTVNRLNFSMNGLGGSASLAGFVAGLAPAAWFRFGAGITSAGGLVSQWNDVSGNGRHLKQATGTNQPTLEADGSILFDGVDNYLKCDAFTFDQPETNYMLFKMLSWTLNDVMWDGNVDGGMYFYQSDLSSPRIRLFAGTATTPIETLSIGDYGVVAAVYNGALSSLQSNLSTPGTGNVGAGNPSGFTLGSRGDGAGNWANIQVKEVILYAAAHAAATRARVIRYLSQVGQLGL